MKDLVLIFALAVAMCSETGAVQNKVLSNDSAKLNIVRYEVRGNPLFEAVQAPSEKKIRVRGIFGPGIMISKSININGIRLEYDMVPNDVKLSLSRLWRVNFNSISSREETITREIFSSLFN